MRLLLDTALVLWRMLDDPRMPAKAIALMDDAGNRVEVSAVSVWEVAIKHTLRRNGQPALAMSGSQFRDELEKVGLAPLAISADQIVGLDLLPLHHSDPFDQLLVAQAQRESMVLLTHDSKLAAYGDCVLVV